MPWWATSLGGGTALAIVALLLLRLELSSLAMPFFVLAVVAVVAGLTGFVLHYRQEQKRLADEDQDRPPAKAHRRRNCTIEKPLLDRLAKALRTLEGLAHEKGWTPDWVAIKENKAEGEKHSAAGDATAAFRSYCRAMLPLMRTQHERRQKEEVFRPVWDKLK